MELRKLKLGKSGVTLVSVTREGEEGETTIEHHIHSPHAPHPDLVEAMAGLLQPAMAFLQLPASYHADLSVSSVHVSAQKDEQRGLVVNLTKKLKGSSRPLNLSTPLLVETEDDGGDWQDLWDGLARIEAEAQAYVTGKRAQGELALEPAGVEG